MTKTMPRFVAKAIADVAAAKAKWEATDSIDKETHADILAQNEFYEEKSGERITSARTDFLMSESDFEKYCKLVYAENCRKGINSGSWELNFWPIHKALYDAEDALIDAIAKEIPNDFTPDIVKIIKNSPKERLKFLRITFPEYTE